MKIQSALILFVFVIASSVTAAGFGSYAQARNYLKYELYRKQEGLMNQAEYLAFIEPMIVRAENTLEGAKFCTRHPNTQECADYLSQMVELNFYAFGAVIDPERTGTLMFDHCLAAFVPTLEQMKAVSGTDFNTDTELAKTRFLIKTANEQFYNQFSAWTKFKIAVHTAVHSTFLLP